jgi:hypothetical protein
VLIVGITATSNSNSRRFIVANLANKYFLESLEYYLANGSGVNLFKCMD